MKQRNSNYVRLVLFNGFLTTTRLPPVQCHPSADVGIFTDRTGSKADLALKRDEKVNWRGYR